MSDIFAAFAATNTAPVTGECIVRLKTSVWYDSRGLHLRKDMTYLRRKSFGFNLLEEEASAVGAHDTVETIVNINECDDGVYEVVACNEKRDYETGYIDSYDLRLVPFQG